MKNELAISDVDRVASVRTALIPSDDVDFVGQHINDFSFAFVSPLGAHHYDAIVHLSLWLFSHPLR